MINLLKDKIKVKHVIFLKFKNEKRHFESLETKIDFLKFYGPNTKP